MQKKNYLLEISTGGEADDELFVSLKGEIDHHSAVRVRCEIDERISSMRPKKAVLDLSGIEFMDSSGLGLVMGRYSKMQAVGGELSVKNPNERIIKIFKLAGLERIIKIEGENKDEE